LKALLLIDSLGSGGAQRQLIYHALALKNLGHDPIIVYYHKKNIYHVQLKNYNLNYQFISKNDQNIFLFIFKLIKFININKINLITTYLYKPNLIGLFIKILKYNTLYLIISERTFELNTTYLNKLFRALYFFSDLITCNSYHQLKVLKSKLPFLVNKIFYLPNVIDFEKFKNTNSKEQFIGNLNNIIAIGRVQTNKNPLLLIKAIGLLKKQSNIIFNVKWFGSIIDINYYNSCCGEIEEYGLNENWSWMGETIDIYENFMQSSILYHGSFGEGFPNVVCEALACQRIVIVSEVYDHPVIIKNNVNGFLFNPNRLSELVDILYNVLTLTDLDIFEIQKQSEISSISNFSLGNHINILSKLSIGKV